MKAITRWTWRWMSGACALAAVIGAGCESSGLGGVGYTGYKRQIMCPVQDVKPANAMELGRRVLAKNGFRIKNVDMDSLTIETYPTEQTVRGQEGRLRDTVVKVPNRVRRTATLEFSTRGGDLQAWCQVKIERLTTADHRVFAQQRQFEDAPTQTPIDREGATTEQQNTVWTSAGRDDSLEQLILSELRDRIQILRKRSLEKEATQPSPAEKPQQ
jgi:hypothetical protein